jgi:hypothetical protein
MIFVLPSADEPIRQGDVFKAMPRVDLSLSALPVVEGGEPFHTSWSEIAGRRSSGAITAVVGMRAVPAIVITQDCDAVRSPDIAMCEITEFRKVEGKYKDLADDSPKWPGAITQHCRINQKWFYLPKCPEIGFTERMGVDFRSVLRIGRPDLDALRSQLRIGRLNDVAVSHFRERVAEFFRRYAYDEWYPLTRLELEEYKRTKPEPVEPFPWQK